MEQDSVDARVEEDAEVPSSRHAWSEINNASTFATYRADAVATAMKGTKQLSEPYISKNEIALALTHVNAGVQELFRWKATTERDMKMLLAKRKDSEARIIELETKVSTLQKEARTTNQKIAKTCVLVEQSQGGGSELDSAGFEAIQKELDLHEGQLDTLLNFVAGQAITNQGNDKRFAEVDEVMGSGSVSADQVMCKQRHQGKDVEMSLTNVLARVEGESERLESELDAKLYLKMKEVPEKQDLNEVARCVKQVCLNLDDLLQEFYETGILDAHPPTITLGWTAKSHYFDNVDALTNDEVKELAKERDDMSGPPPGKVSVLLKKQAASQNQQARPKTPAEEEKELLDEQEFIETERNRRHSLWGNIDGDIGVSQGDISLPQDEKDSGVLAVSEQARQAISSHNRNTDSKESTTQQEHVHTESKEELTANLNSNSSSNSLVSYEGENRTGDSTQYERPATGSQRESDRPDGANRSARRRSTGQFSAKLADTAGSRTSDTSPRSVERQFSDRQAADVSSMDGGRNFGNSDTNLIDDESQFGSSRVMGANVSGSDSKVRRKRNRHSTGNTKNGEEGGSVLKAKFASIVRKHAKTKFRVTNKMHELRDMFDNNFDKVWGEMFRVRKRLHEFTESIQEKADMRSVELRVAIKFDEVISELQGSLSKAGTDESQFRMAATELQDTCAQLMAIKANKSEVLDLKKKIQNTDRIGEQLQAVMRMTETKVDQVDVQLLMDNMVQRKEMQSIIHNLERKLRKAIENGGGGMGGGMGTTNGPLAGGTMDAQRNQQQSGGRAGNRKKNPSASKAPDQALTTDSHSHSVQGPGGSSLGGGYQYRSQTTIGSTNKRLHSGPNSNMPLQGAGDSHWSLGMLHSSPGIGLTSTAITNKSAENTNAMLAGSDKLPSVIKLDVAQSGTNIYDRMNSSPKDGRSNTGGGGSGESVSVGEGDARAMQRVAISPFARSQQARNGEHSVDVNGWEHSNAQSGGVSGTGSDGELISTVPVRTMTPPKF